MVSRFFQWLVTLLWPRLARDVALDLEAVALERQADRVARLHAKADELRAAGHEDLADHLLREVGRLSAENPNLFRTDLPGLPDLAGLPAPEPVPPSPRPSLPPPPSPNGPGRKPPRGSPRSAPESQPAAGTVPDGPSSSQP
jgi:hypothetical protein